jgi:hypothetical protein
MIYNVMLQCSNRLYNLLLRYCVENKGIMQTWQEYAESTPATKVYITRLNEMRNCGEGSIQEFIRLRNEATIRNPVMR